MMQFHQLRTEPKTNLKDQEAGAILRNEDYNVASLSM